MRRHHQPTNLPTHQIMHSYLLDTYEVPYLALVPYFLWASLRRLAERPVSKHHSVRHLPPAICHLPSCLGVYHLVYLVYQVHPDTETKHSYFVRNPAQDAVRGMMTLAIPLDRCTRRPIRSRDPYPLHWQWPSGSSVCIFEDRRTSSPSLPRSLPMGPAR